MLFFWEVEVKFTKPPLTVEQQLAKLRGRGLEIGDEPTALWALRRLGYYRLAAYTLPFQQDRLPDKPFHTGATLCQVLALYTFDRELRLLVLDAVERVEVVLRTSMVYHLSLAHGAHWFMDTGLFSTSFDHSRFISLIEEEMELSPKGSKPNRVHAEVFINHYYRKYGDPRLPPAWMVAETLSLGTLSRLYSSLKCPKSRQTIATAFGYNEAILGPWLHTLTYVRNLCAHHARLWNRQFVIKAQIPKRHARRIPVNDRFYAVAYILADLLATVESRSRWRFRLRELIENHPEANRPAMGFPGDWKNQPLWQDELPDAATRAG